MDPISVNYKSCRNASNPYHTCNDFCMQVIRVQYWYLYLSHLPLALSLFLAPSLNKRQRYLKLLSPKTYMFTPDNPMLCFHIGITLVGF